MGVNYEMFEDDIRSFMKPLEESGYTLLNGNEQHGLRSIEGQLREYYLTPLEMEPHDHIWDLLEDGEVHPHSFHLTVYDGPGGDAPKFLFHSFNQYPNLIVKKVELEIGGKSFVSEKLLPPHEMYQWHNESLCTRKN